MQVMVTGMYAFAAQGRICGIIGLKLKHQPELAAKGFALSKTFKTAGTHHFQPVPIPTEIDSMQQIYFIQLRPLIVTRSGKKSSPETPLFLNYNGKEFKNLGKYVGLFLREVFTFLLYL
jgi:hypothetical protein